MQNKLSDQLKIVHENVQAINNLLIALNNLNRSRNEPDELTDAVLKEASASLSHVCNHLSILESVQKWNE